MNEAFKPEILAAPEVEEEATVPDLGLTSVPTGPMLETTSILPSQLYFASGGSDSDRKLLLDKAIAEIALFYHIMASPHVQLSYVY